MGNPHKLKQTNVRGPLRELCIKLTYSEAENIWTGLDTPRFVLVWHNLISDIVSWGAPWFQGLAEELNIGSSRRLHFNG